MEETMDHPENKRLVYRCRLGKTSDSFSDAVRVKQASGLSMPTV